MLITDLWEFWHVGLLNFVKYDNLDSIISLILNYFSFDSACLVIK